MTRPSWATWSSMSRTGPPKHRFSTSKTAPSRLEFVSSGQNRRKFRCRAFRRKTSRRRSPSCRVDSWCSVAGRGTGSAYAGRPCTPPPARPRVPSGVVLDLADPRPAAVERLGEIGVDAEWIVTCHDVRVVAVTTKEVPYRPVPLATENGRAGDLVSVQVEDRQHRAVPRRVEKVDALPRALERSW